MQTSIPTSFRFTIGGEAREALDGRTAASVNPATELAIADAPTGASADVDAAVKAAQAAQASWSGMTWSARARVLHSLARRLEQEKETFAVLDSMDGGNPLAAMRSDVASGLEALTYFAGIAGEAKGSSFPASSDMINFTIREPYGVVGRIVAFNHPFMFAIAKVSAALAAGNTVVLKPSDHTPLSALHLGAVAAEVLPPGVLNVVAGDAEVGNALASHPDVPRLAFTGSVGVARRIMSTASERLKVLTFELGGKNPMVVAPDVDVKKAAIASIAGMNFARSQGQSCQSFSRVFVHASIYDEFIGHAAQQLSELRVGDPLQSATDIGPLTFAEHRDRVANYIRVGEAEGARVVYGGSHAAVPEKGFFVPPTMFADVTQDMTIAREEIFGPVMSIMRWDDEAKLVSDLNAVDYGLTASIWTNDASRAYRLASAVEAGYVWINKVGPRPYGAPFGGYKLSGFGKESNIEELLSFTREKVIDHAL
ncbi:aldehyde dehydrogenase family protein [Microbacterium pseudoresistens]|uniref:Betaine-aldehyde dehydrogenase n=1 Tax=Microbacterium pseudoresistens TaxID=640634 RepID=A0A7Y9JMJ9_9MICO|nr:aldehyde dehydrogenase family protein [Microbacterium pseudoresistens]NYD54862.1 betaine-aldehyde dehydrogenase [Microbacterium pseudoresistens]